MLRKIFGFALLIMICNTAFPQATPIPVGSIRPGESVVIVYDVKVNDPLPGGVTTITNQGTITGTNFSQLVTDDPKTVPGPDATITQVQICTQPVASVPGNQNFCNGQNVAAGTLTFSSTISPTTYSWTNSDPSIGLAASGSGDQLPAFTATNTGTQANTATITVTPTSGIDGCVGQAKTFTITVNPTTAVTVPSSTGMCNNVTLPTGTLNFTSATSGAVFNWTNSNTAIGLGSSGTGSSLPTFTTTNTGTTASTATITVTPSLNGCPGTPQSFTITVNPTPVITISPTSQSVCNNTSTSAVTFSSTVSGTTYTWTRDINTIGGANTGTGNVPSFTATNTGNGTVTVTYTVTATASGCAASPTTSTFTITVNPTPVLSISPTSQVVCNNTATALVTLSSNVPGTVITWTRDNNTIGGTNSGSGNVPSFIATNTGNGTVTVTYTVTATASGCPASPTTSTFTITVKPTTAVTITPASQAVCNNTSTTAVAFSSTVAGTTYSWTRDNNTIGGANSGTSNPVPSFTATNNGTAPVTSTYTLTSSANGCAASPTTSTFTITVNPTPTVTVPVNQVYCNGTNVPVNTLTFSGAVSGTTFAWTNTNTAIGLGAAGSGSSLPAFTATNTGNGTITATVTVTPTANNCAGTAQSFTITVQPTAVVTVPSNVVYCNGTVVSSGTLNFTGNVAGTVFNWTNSNTNIGLAGSGSGNSLPTFMANGLPSGQTATVTVTPTANSCPGAAKTFTISAYPAPGVSTPTITQPTCAQPAGIIVVNATDPASLEYQLNNGAWQTSNTFGGLASGTYDIHVRVQSGGVCVTSWSGNPAVINPAPIPTATIADQFAVSPGGAKNTIYKNYGQPWLKYQVVVSGGASPYSYAWAGSGIQGATNKDTVRVQPVQVAGTYTYTVTIMDNLGCTITKSIGVKVADVSCGGNKLFICYPATTTTVCIGPGWIPGYLASGYIMGSCASGTSIIPGDVGFELLQPDMYGSSDHTVFGVKVSPNPTSGNFRVQVSGNDYQRISIRVTDVLGRTMFSKTNVLAGEMIVFGDTFNSGSYFAEVIQGDNKKVVKLVKVK